MIVVDASAILDVLLRSSQASEIEDLIFGQGVTLHAPHLLDLEVIQVLRRFVRVGSMHPSRGLEAIRVFMDFPIERYDHITLLERIWELRDNMTAYDASYVALAEALPAKLLTRDARLASVASHYIRVHLV